LFLLVLVEGRGLLNQHTCPRKGGGLWHRREKGRGERKKEKEKKGEKSGTCYFDGSSFFLRSTQSIGISGYISI
jgi:hypothetical protein